MPFTRTALSTGGSVLSRHSRHPGGDPAGSPGEGCSPQEAGKTAASPRAKPGSSPRLPRRRRKRFRRFGACHSRPALLASRCEGPLGAAGEALAGSPRCRGLDGDLHLSRRRPDAPPRGWEVAAAPPGRAGPWPTAPRRAQQRGPDGAGGPSRRSSPPLPRGQGGWRRLVPVPEEEEPQPRSQRDKVNWKVYKGPWVGRERRGGEGEGHSRPVGRSWGLPEEEEAAAAAAAVAARRGRRGAAAANSPLPSPLGDPAQALGGPLRWPAPGRGTRPPSLPASLSAGEKRAAGTGDAALGGAPTGVRGCWRPPEALSPPALGVASPPPFAANPLLFPPCDRPAPMALSKGLRLLWKQEPGPSALLEARTRQDCLLLEAGTVAALSKCPAAGGAGQGRFPRGACGGRLWRGEVASLWVPAWCLCGARGRVPGCGGSSRG